MIVSIHYMYGVYPPTDIYMCMCVLVISENLNSFSVDKNAAFCFA